MYVIYVREQFCMKNNDASNFDTDIRLKNTFLYEFRTRDEIIFRLHVKICLFHPGVKFHPGL